MKIDRSRSKLTRKQKATLLRTAAVEGHWLVGRYSLGTKDPAYPWLPEGAEIGSMSFPRTPKGVVDARRHEAQLRATGFVVFRRPY